MSKGAAPQRTGVLRLRQLSSYLLPLDEGSRSQTASLNKEPLSSGVNEGWAWAGMRDGRSLHTGERVGGPDTGEENRLGDGV